jgi:hypothetical protein
MRRIFQHPTNGYFGVLALVSLLGWSGLSAFWPNCSNGPAQVTNPQYTFQCQCTCNVQHSGLQSYGSQDPVNWVTVCAPDQKTAVKWCSGACQHGLQDQYDRAPKFTADTNTVQTCAVDERFVTQKDAKACSFGLSQALSARPPDATQEGPVDFGLSSMELFSSDNNDRATVPIQGKLAMIGGNCPGQQCDFQIGYARLVPKDGPFTSEKGTRMSDVLAINQGVWTGTKFADGTIQMSPNSSLALSGSFDDEQKLFVFDSSSYIQGKIKTLYRTKVSGGGTQENALVIDTDFRNGPLQVKLHLHYWLTNCQPWVTANASCVTDPDSVAHLLRLDSDFGLLGNMLSQDLCNAMAAADTTTVCSSTVSDDNEFTAFSCAEQSNLNAADYWERAKHLNFVWRDHLGGILGTQPILNLKAMPWFPVTLSIENEWGRSVSSTVDKVPLGEYCPEPGRPYTKPMVDDYRLDWCRMPAAECGQAAAEAWCAKQGYHGLLYFTEDPDVGQQGIVTKVIGTGELCDAGYCDSFQTISCVP